MITKTGLKELAEKKTCEYKASVNMFIDHQFGLKVVSMLLVTE